MVGRQMRRLAVPLAVLLLAGCTVGPNYKRSRSAVINNPAAQAAFLSDNKATQIANPPDNWWHLYNDPTLDTLVQRAFAANTSLKVAQANLENAYALLAAAEAGREASVTTSDSTDYGQRSAQAVLSKIPAAQLERYHVGITVSYDADLFGGIRRGIEAANDDSEAAADARDLVKVSVAAETTRAYADICDDGDELAALRHAIALQNQSLAFVRLLHENGRATNFDVAAGQAQIEALESKLPPLQAKQTNAAYRLAALMGEPPESYDPTWLACQQPLVVHTLLPVGDGKSLLSRRPDVREAERRLAAATARVGQAEAKLYPDFKLGGAIGSTGAAFDAFAPVTNLFNIGPSVSWDLNQSAIRAHIAQAKAQVKARQAAFDGTVLAALQEAQSAITSYQSTLAQTTSLTEARNFDAQVAASMAELQKGGKVNALAPLKAEQSLAAADVSLASAQTSVSQSQIALFYALGGGWGASSQTTAQSAAPANSAPTAP